MTSALDPISREPAQAVCIIRAEFDEMPGMHLTLEQAARLWRLSRASCEELLDELVAAGFLVRDRSRRYARRGDAR